MYLSILTAFAAAALATPLEERNINCNAVNTIITLMRQQHVATPFCSSLLSIPKVTSTYTQTSTPACVTVTESTSSVQTMTAITSSVVYGITTVYPVVAVSTTSTCEIGATYVPTTPARMAKRAPPPPGSPPPPPRGPPPPPPAGPTPIARPTCLSKFGGSAITSACSCLNIPTPTKAVIATVTLPAKTVCRIISQNKGTWIITDLADHHRYRSNRPSDRDVHLHNHVFHINLQRHPVLHQHLQRPPSTIKHTDTRRGPN